MKSLAMIETTALGQSNLVTDALLVDSWLKEKTPATRRAYGLDWQRFKAFIGNKPLAALTIPDLQAFKDSLTGADRTRNRTLCAVKSLLSWGKATGVLAFNAGAAVKLFKPDDTRGERVLSDAQVQAMIAAASTERNRRVILFLAATGLRVAELVSIRWRNLQPTDSTAILTVKGKGSKTRRLKLPAWLWDELRSWRGEAAPDDRIFPVADRTAHWIVATTAKRAGIKSAVSPHWFRHYCATKMIRKGSPLHFVQQYLGHADLSTTAIYLELVDGESAADYMPDPRILAAA